jgi:hypothetical protein
MKACVLAGASADIAWIAASLQTAQMLPKLNYPHHTADLHVKRASPIVKNAEYQDMIS